MGRLAGIFVVLLCLVSALLPGSAKAAAGDVSLLPKPNAAEQYLFAAANRERVAHGLQMLHRDDSLGQAAAMHAGEMAERADISHQFSGEPDLADRGASAGVRFSLISENVAEAPDTATIHELWMDSPAHRENLLDPRVNCVGIAVVSWQDQMYAVEDFASSVEAMAFPEQEALVAGALANSGLQTSTGDDARDTCAMAHGYAGDHRPGFIMRYTASHLNAIPGELQARLESGKYHKASVGACKSNAAGPFSSYTIAVLLYP